MPIKLSTLKTKKKTKLPKIKSIPDFEKLTSAQKCKIFDELHDKIRAEIVEESNTVKTVLNAQLQANNLEKELVELRRQSLIERNEHNDLKQKIASLLDSDQLEAARICGCSPEVYALEWIQICKEKVRELTPAYTGQVLGLQLFKQGNY